jgi:Thrombospondin type 3 repeat/Cohesin domain/Dockerin type I domain
MRIRLPYRLTILAFVGAAFVGTLALSQAPLAQPTSAVTNPVVSVDAIPDANNTATTVGAIDPCQTTTVGSSFNIDIVIQNVTSISGFQANLLYNPAIVHVTGVDYHFLLASTPVAVVDVGDSVPDSDGTFVLAAVQFPLVPAAGSGVLARVTLQAVGVGGSSLDLASVKLADGSGNPIPPSDSTTHVYLGPINSGAVIVGGICGPDSDGDGIPDSVDNCPNWYNPAQNLPIWPVPANDPDCDGFTTAIENFVGTDPNVACGGTAIPDGSSSTWPPDLNNDGKANIADVLKYIPVFNTMAPGPPYNKRYDLNADGKINIADVLKFMPFFNQSCAP